MTEQTFEEMLDESLPKTKAGMLAAKHGRIPRSKKKTPTIGRLSSATRKFMKNRAERKKARKRAKKSRRKNRRR
ncbi:MAG: hypothetical protein ACXADF_14930 [Candidatus Thorarchaeota archaeon]|jgi:hypothetical protein